MKRQIKICGATYKIRKASEQDEKELRNSYGYCDFEKKDIVLNNGNGKYQNDKTLRHEIAHAFFFECGLLEYGLDETLIDFLAMQLPKLFDICKQLDILER